MPKQYIYLFLILLIAVSVFSFYTFSQSPETAQFKLVTIKGQVSCMDYSHFPFGVMFPAPDSSAKESQGQETAMLLWKDSILFVEVQEDVQFVTLYTEKDGNLLSFTSQKFILFQNDKPASVTIDAGTSKEAWQWLKDAKDSQIRSLRFLTILNNESPKLDTEQEAILKRVAQINPHLGLNLYSNSINQVLPLFHPQVLILGIEDPLTGLQISQLANKISLRTLIISFSCDYDSGSLAFLKQLQNLRRLTVSGGSFSLEQLPALPNQLYSLALFDYSGGDVMQITLPSRLRELSLRGEKISNISFLQKLKDLNALDLSGCTNIKALAGLKYLKKLVYLGLPKGFEQESFLEALSSLDNLEILYLEYPGLGNLRILKKLPSLRALIIMGELGKEPALDYSGLYEMKNLQYLAIGTHLITDDDQISGLKKALPNCRIVRAEGICLGSGWILLLLPFLSAPFLFGRFWPRVR